MQHLADKNLHCYGSPNRPIPAEGDAKGYANIVSGVFIVCFPVEEMRDDAQHWLDETCFIAELATEKSKAVGFHGCVVLFMFVANSSLP